MRQKGMSIVLIRVNTVPVLDEDGATRHVPHGTIVSYRRQPVAIETVPVDGTVSIDTPTGRVTAWVEPAYAARRGRPSVATSDVSGPRAEYRTAAPTVAHARTIAACDRTPNRGTAHIALVPVARGSAAGTARVTFSWLDPSLSPARRSKLARMVFELAGLENPSSDGAWIVRDLDTAHRELVAVCAQLGIMPAVNRVA
jgi:hypothetical protein